MSANTVSQQIYDMLVSKDFEPNALDLMGKDVNDPQDADLFSFTFKTVNKNYGTVVILLDSEKNIEVYYGDTVGRAMEDDDKHAWYDFLYLLRSIAKKNMYTFSLNNMNKLKYNMKTLAAITEGTLLEGYYGTSKTSYSKQPSQTKLIIRHSKAIGEGDQRFRNIESLFVETSEGERFKLPFTSLTGGKAMARHIAEGGNPYDAFGQHIIDTVSETATLSRFLRATKNKGYTGDAQQLVDEGVKHLKRLKRKAKRMIGRKGYHEELEAYDPITIQDLDETIEKIKQEFVHQDMDQRISEALPLLASIAQSIEEADEETNIVTPITIPKIKSTTTTKASGDTRAKQFKEPVKTAKVSPPPTTVSKAEPDITKMKIKDIPGHYIGKAVSAVSNKMQDIEKNYEPVDYGGSYSKLGQQIQQKISGSAPTPKISQDQIQQKYDKLKSIPYIGDRAAELFMQNIGSTQTEDKVMKELAEFEQWVDSILAENPTEEEPQKSSQTTAADDRDTDDMDDSVYEEPMARVPVDAPVSQYKVQAGDTLYSLGQKYKTDVNTLKMMNRQDTDQINVGQTLNVPQMDTTPTTSVAPSTTVAPSTKSYPREEVEEGVIEEAKVGDTCSCCDNKIDEQGKCGCDESCSHCGGHHDIGEVVDIDTGKQALKAERDPMLEELARILQLSK